MKRLQPPPDDVSKPDRREFQAWCQQVYDFFRLVGRTTIDLGNIGAGGIATVTITVAGCVPDLDQTVLIGPPSNLDAGLLWSGSITAANTVVVRVYNSTGGGIDPASGTWTARVFQ